MQAHLMRDAAHADLDIGAAEAKFRTLYVASIVADTVSGTTMAGQSWNYAGGMTVDAKAAADTTVTIPTSLATRADLAVPV